MKPRPAEKANIKDALRNLPDKTRRVLIFAEIIVVYLIILISLLQAWPYHNVLRFVMLIPMYHAGASFGFRGGFLASLLVLILFTPIIPIETPDKLYQFKPETSVLLLVSYLLFGIIMGGTMGETRKTRRYIENLSGVLMRIFGATDERSVLMSACREAALLTEAASGVILLRNEGGGDISEWLLAAAFGDEKLIGETAIPSSDNILVWCVRNNAPFMTSSTENDTRVTVGKRAANVRALMAAPVSYENTVYGAFMLMDRKSGDNFSEKELSIARTIAESAGGAIHNITQEKERQEEKLREEQMHELFSRYVSSSIADYVLEHPGLLAGRWQEVTVLVSDIRDFTVLSEKIPARELVSQLNEYFTAMVDVIFQNKGTIDKFIGDCVIAYWGAPAPDPEHAANTINAATAMSRALEQLNDSWTARGMIPLTSGIAIHTCNVLMGNLGDDRKKAFTIMGEEVNKTIRMETLTKVTGNKIIVSETAALASGKELEAITDAPKDFGRLFTLKAE